MSAMSSLIRTLSKRRTKGAQAVEEGEAHELKNSASA